MRRTGRGGEAGRRGREGRRTGRGEEAGRGGRAGVGQQQKTLNTKVHFHSFQRKVVKMNALVQETFTFVLVLNSFSKFIYVFGL